MTDTCAVAQHRDAAVRLDVKQESGGLLLLCRITPLPRRNTVHFCSGAYIYVENIPEDLYEALRARARQRHRSIAAEVLELLAQSIPTQKELKARKDLLRKLERIASQHKLSDEGIFPSTEGMQRQDRQR